jgi:hypothetical protein
VVNRPEEVRPVLYLDLDVGFNLHGTYVSGYRYCREGYGACRFLNGNLYCGQWAHDMMHGQGACVPACRNFVWCCSSFTNPCKWTGVMFYGDGSVYDGLWCRNARYTPATINQLNSATLTLSRCLVQARQGDLQTAWSVDLLRRLEGRQEVRFLSSTPVQKQSRISNKAEKTKIQQAGIV